MTGPGSVAAGRTLADVLERILVEGTAPRVDPGGLDRLAADLEDAAAPAAREAGASEADPLRLAKGVVATLLECPRRACADHEPTGPELERGRPVDAAVKAAVTAARRPPDLWEAAVGHLAAHGDPVEAPAGVDPDDVRTRAAAVLDALGDLDAARWWVRCDEPAGVRLAGGAVLVTCRPDLVCGGPPTDLPAVVVEIKSGPWRDGHRADLHLYALLVALRDRAAPAACVEITPGPTLVVEPVTARVLEAATRRLRAAMAAAADLAAGAAPEERPGAWCATCPLRPRCGSHARWVARGTGEGGRPGA